MAQISGQLAEWQASINRGIVSFKLGRYDDAVAAFQKAVALHGDDAIPHLYLGIGFNQQFVPSANPQLHPEAGVLAELAEKEFQRALALDPENWLALVLLGRLALDQGKFPEARSWYTTALDLDPSNADIVCTLGAIAWRESGGTSDAGIADFQRAVALDPLNSTAMEYLDASYRPRDLAMAEQWRQKAALAQDEKRRLSEAGVVTAWPPDLAGTFQLLRDAARPMVPPAPPPPPPPPGLIRNRTTVTPAWNFRHPPGETGPPPILVNPDAQARILVSKVDPANPSGFTGRPETMRLSIIVGKDGHVRSAGVVGADSPLAEAAVKAVLQWIYQPTLSNWEPVEVRSEVSVTMRP